MRKNLCLAVFITLIVLVVNPLSSRSETGPEIEKIMATAVNGFEYYLLNLESGLNRHASKIKVALRGLKDIRITYVSKKNVLVITIKTMKVDGEPERIPYDTLEAIKGEISSQLKVASRYTSRIIPNPKSLPSFNVSILEDDVDLVIKESWRVAGGTKFRFYLSSLKEKRWEIKEHDIDSDG